MGNAFSANDGKELARLGQVTLPYQAIYNLVVGALIVWLALQMRNLNTSAASQELATVTRVQCMARNYCLVDVQTETGAQLQGIPIQGFWTVNANDRLWVSYSKDRELQPVQGSARVVLEPSGQTQAKPFLTGFWLIIAVLGLFMVAQGAIRLGSKSFDSARKLSSAGFFS